MNVTDVFVAPSDEGIEVRVLDVVHWGLSAFGADEKAAVRALRTDALGAFRLFLRRHGTGCPRLGEVRVLSPEEWTSWIQQPATDEEFEVTVRLRGWARDDLLGLMRSASDEELDWADPDRVLPDWAWWRTTRQMGYHLAITEARYYLHRLGVDPPGGWGRVAGGAVWRVWPDVFEALRQSDEHVGRILPWLPRDLVTRDLGTTEGMHPELWTTRLVFWMLAWHERGEVDVVRRLLRKARAAIG